MVTRVAVALAVVHVAETLIIQRAPTGLARYAEEGGGGGDEVPLYINYEMSLLTGGPRPASRSAQVDAVPNSQWLFDFQISILDVAERITESNNFTYLFY